MNKKLSSFTASMALLSVLLCSCLQLRSTAPTGAAADTPTELTCLVNISSALLEQCNGDLNQSPFFQELEKRTNVHISWVTSVNEQESRYFFKQTNTQMPDLIINAYQNHTYGTGLDTAIDEGTILDLSELIPKYAPNYYAIIQENENLTDIVYTDAGRLAAVYAVRQEKQGPWIGPMIRKDWLDELNLKIPVTYDDWETVLTAFHEKKHASAPLYLPGTGYMPGDYLSAGFGVSSSFYHIGDNIYYGPAEEGWKEYLMLLNRWYDLGLISPYFSTGDIFPNEDNIANGSSGIWCSYYLFSSFLSAKDCPDISTAPIPAPKKEASDESHFRFPDTYVDNYIAISSSCAHPEAALKWLDYLYSKEGTLFATYGLEGETYTIKEDGRPEYTELITDNPDGLNFYDALQYYTLPTYFPIGYTNWKRELQANKFQTCQEMMDIWSSSDTDYLLPTGLNLTPQESRRYSEIMAKVSDCMHEYTIQFIMGTLSFDSYDDYLTRLNNSGLKEALQILQNAYLR